MIKNHSASQVVPVRSHSVRSPKEKTVGTDGTGEKSPPVLFLYSRDEERTGTDGNGRERTDHQHPATNHVISTELALAHVSPPAASPADHPAEIGGMVSPPYFGTRVVPTKFAGTTPDRLARLHALGLPDPKALAARLAHRDRDLDDRRLCLECRHLAGHAQGAWRCSNWPKAGMLAIRAVYAQLPAELVTMLQRCDGFDDLIPNPESKTP